MYGTVKKDLMKQFNHVAQVFFLIGKGTVSSFKIFLKSESRQLSFSIFTEAKQENAIFTLVSKYGYVYTMTVLHIIYFYQVKTKELKQRIWTSLVL